MRKTIRRAVAGVLTAAMLVCLCSCGMTQYGVPRPPDDTGRTNVDVRTTEEADPSEVRNAFYTDQTRSMYGFCKKPGYVTTLNLVRSLLAGDVVHPYDIYRYDYIVDKIDESVFIEHYNDGRLNDTEYYQSDIPSAAVKKKKNKAAKKSITPLRSALSDAFDSDKYTDGLCVFTTDGYEQKRDYAVMFTPLARHVFNRGNAVAFIGVNSGFSGKVYWVEADNSKPYPYKGDRMFYLIVAGPVDKVTRFSADLSERLTKKKIENYVSTFLSPGGMISFVEDSLKLEPEDDEAVSLGEAAKGRSFMAWDRTDTVEKEEGKDYYPTFSAELPKSGKARSVFTVAAELKEGAEMPALRAVPEFMSYKGALEEDEEEEEEETDKKGKKAAGTVSGGPDQAKLPDDAEAGDTTIGNLIVGKADYKVVESTEVVLEPVNGGKYQITTVFNDTSAVKENGDILVKYTICPEEVTDVPQWVLDNSAPDTSEENKGRTLDLEFMYKGLREACNQTQDNSELLTFYCYYSIN